MSKQANKTIIGVFVLGAIALTVAGMLVFGSGKFLTERSKYVMFYEGSVKGLNVGAPVIFRGVKIGTVTDILLNFDPADLSVHIPVIIEVETDRFTTVAGERVLGEKYQYTKQLIDKGLRAQLILQSMVTGQLMVNLDFFPDKPVMLSGIEYRHPEIPTVPSGLEEFTKTLEKLPIDVLFNKLVSAVEGIEKLVNAPETGDSIKSLDLALKSARKLLDDLDREIEPLVTNIEGTSDAARAAFEQAEKTLAFEEGVPGQLAESIDETMTSARRALDQAEVSLASLQDSVSEDSELIYKLNSTLRELSAAAEAIHNLADYFERHPDSLIRGKRRRTR